MNLDDVKKKISELNDNIVYDIIYKFDWQIKTVDVSVDYYESLNLSKKEFDRLDDLDSVSYTHLDNRLSPSIRNQEKICH